MGFLAGVAVYVALVCGLVFGPIASCVEQERAECEARTCPEGTQAKVTRYDGCLCVSAPSE